MGNFWAKGLIGMIWLIIIFLGIYVFVQIIGRLLYCCIKTDYNKYNIKIYKYINSLCKKTNSVVPENNLKINIPNHHIIIIGPCQKIMLGRKYTC